MDKTWRNYYKRLGINQDASEEQIKTAFKAKMKELHPDMNKDNQGYQPDEARDRLQIILEGKDILLDPGKRHEYDVSYNEEMRRRKVEEEMKTYGVDNEVDLEKVKLRNERAKQAPEFIKAKLSFDKEQAQRNTNKTNETISRMQQRDEQFQRMEGLVNRNSFSGKKSTSGGENKG